MRPLLVRADAARCHRRRRRRQDGREGPRRSTAIDRTRHARSALAAAGTAREDIDIVVASHLHFDHAGGFTVRDALGRGSCRGSRGRATCAAAASGTTRRTRTSATARAISPRTTCRSSRPASWTSSMTTARSLPGVSVAADRRPHDAPPDRADRVGRPDGGLRRRPDADDGAHRRCRGSWATTCIRWTRWPSSARSSREAVEREYLIFFEHDPAIAAGYHPRDGTAGKGGCDATRRVCSTMMSHCADRHHRRQRPVRHGGADRSRRAHARRRRSAIRRARTCWRRCAGKRVAFLARHGAGIALMPVRAELPRQHLRHEDARRRVHPLGERGGQSAGGLQAAATSSSPISSSIARAGASARSSATASSRTSASRIRSARPLGDDRRTTPATRPARPCTRGGTYVCMEGPQFSTLAESKLYRVVGHATSSA